MMIIGDQVFSRTDGLALHAALHAAAEKLGCVRSAEDGGWNGFNILHRHAGRVGALDVGFVSQTEIKTEDMDVLFLLNSDEESILSSCSKKSFVIYQGHHGDLGAHRADVILPGSAYTEKNATYVNMEGRVQQTNQSVFPVGEAKEDWKIIRALSERVGGVLPYDSLLDLRQRIVSEWPVLGSLDVLPNAPWGSFGKSGKLLKLPFKNTIKDFYMTNVITRASTTMQECSDKFVTKTKPQKKAAE
jgi:NADH-quinone oxidoreductase subunit G